MVPIEVLVVGAEAVLVRDVWYGFEVVRKKRLRKEYRHRVLDERIRRRRTVLEAKLMSACKRAGIPVPTVLCVDEEEGEIVMDWISGEKLRDVMHQMDEREVARIFERVGEEVGLMHKAGVIHGDLTTSNMILVGEKVYILDFGLGYFGGDLESRAVDLHLLIKAIESTHPRYAHIASEALMRGYSRILGEDEAERVFERIREIKMRGRYVAERRQRF